MSPSRRHLDLLTTDDSGRLIGALTDILGNPERAPRDTGDTSQPHTSATTAPVVALIALPAPALGGVPVLDRLSELASLTATVVVTDTRAPAQVRR